jgi:5-formyltetrahydrofolate cyclo-ligase
MPKRLYKIRCPVREDLNIPGALSILMGAVPDRSRGSGHTAPTYVSRFPGSHVPRPGRHLILADPKDRTIDRMSDEAIEEAKAGLRLRARAQRAAFAEGSRSEAAASASRHFIEGVALTPTDVVAAYWPIREELDCRPLLTWLMDNLQPVCLPVVRGDEEPLDMRLWEQGTPLYPSGFGTLAPADTSPIAEPDVIIVPLLGFDATGTRLGYGGGYYDRTIAAMRKRPRLVGFAFSTQELPNVPRAPHDRPLDSIITELGIRHFAAAEPA